MAYTVIDNPGAEFAVDRDVVARLNQSFRRAEAQWTLSEVRETSNGLRRAR
ncbi:MAG: hypothetical protein PVH00_12855 [Gemmatimonadota bacterium]|jgi:hypothetical protein